MVEVIFTNDAIEDIYRLTYFLLETYPEAALETGKIITDGLQVLATHPLVGHQNTQGLRKLVISRGRSGYIAVYEYDELLNRVLVMAIKHQRERDYD